MRRLAALFFVLIFSFAAAQAQKTERPSKSKREASPPATSDYEALRKELVAMAERDQQAMFYAARNPNDKEATPKMNETVEANNRRVRGIVEKYGWLSVKQIGADGAQALWLVVQHADRDADLQKLCLKKLRAAVKKGEATTLSLAYLTDRVLINAGKKQLYGTQLDYDQEGNPFPKPIKNEAAVNRRRAAMRLEPLEEYIEKTRDVLRQLRKNQTPGKN